MPYKVKKTNKGDYKAKHTSKEKARAQQKLLYAIEEDPDFISRRKKKNGMS